MAYPSKRLNETTIFLKTTDLIDKSISLLTCWDGQKEKNSTLGNQIEYSGQYQQFVCCYFDIFQEVQHKDGVAIV